MSHPPHAWDTPSSASALESIYITPDVVAQRAAVLEALALSPGEAVLDVGSGPGLLALECATAVGPSGRVEGVDVSPAMLTLASARAQATPWLAHRLGDVCALPFADSSFDAVVITQVLLYVADVPRALAEVRRVLKPRGRVVVLDTDWASCVWASRNDSRMARVLRAWSEHFADAHAARSVPRALRAAGFAVARVAAHTIVNSPDAHSPHCVGAQPFALAGTYSGGMAQLIRGFVPGRAGVSDDDAAAWLADLQDLGLSDGGSAYFFSLTRFLVCAYALG